MKPGSTLLVSLLLLLSTPIVSAQGIYQLWGMTKDGGDDNAGAMFSTTCSGNNFQSRHNFSISNPGSNPQLGNLAEFNGRFYGMTQAGGSNNAGIIFEWNPATNQYTKKIALDDMNGSGPLGSLVLHDGKFYGMTEHGGTHGTGVIFEWNPTTNNYTKKYDFIDNPFDGFNGCNPSGNLTLSAGKFYGMTGSGGDNDKGVIFEWDPATNNYTKKLDFNGSNGSKPFGSLTLYAGKFYGMTNQGGSNGEGVLFEWDPVTNNCSNKKDMHAAGGNNPTGNLTLVDGKFYGMTHSGGANNDGVIFEWDQSLNVYTIKYDFDDANGYWPSGSLTLHNGKLYGMAFRGGINDKGVIFEWNPVLSQYTKKIDLTSIDGKFPQADLVHYNGKFYGMTTQGGINERGVIFEWDAVTNNYAKKIDLNDVSKGIKPTGGLTRVAGKYYGMTNSGGSGINGRGVIFEYDPSTNNYTKKTDLVTSSGDLPYGNLSPYNNKLYGMTNKGGTDDEGVIFEFDPATNVYTTIVDLSFDDGSSPRGSLTYYDGKFYGMTNSGGSDGGGVIFEFDPSTNTYTKKKDLVFATGSSPYGNLVVYNNKFYGMTRRGGASSVGVIFEWDPSTNTYTKKIDLSNTNGKFPAGSLSMIDGKFYGLTPFGGSNDKGVLFEWNPASNIYTKKIEFATTDAANPFGSLTHSAGMFYGMTSAGGANNTGVVFEWDPAMNVYTKKSDLYQQATFGQLPGIINDLALVPAPVAKGNANSCVSFTTVTIDNSNNNIWVPIVDDKGDAVAEIKANGNNLGQVTASMYINDGTIREDGSKRLYLDRNITLTPQVQPTSPVDIRLYFRNAEYNALKNAVNSVGQPSGVNSIDDVGVYKNNDDCSAAIGFIANPVVITAADSWESDHVISISAFSFSSFYFSSKAQGGPLPITRLELHGRLENDNGEINWKTTDEFNTASFDLERSVDGITYTTIVNVAAINQLGIHHYYYTDKKIASLGSPDIFYRIRQRDLNGAFKYSGIIVLNVKKGTIVMLYPNPVIDQAKLSINISKPEHIQGRIIDNAGRVVKQLQWNLQAGSNSFTVDVSNLAKGMYYLELMGETINEHKQFIKQ